MWLAHLGQPLHCCARPSILGFQIYPLSKRSGSLDLIQPSIRFAASKGLHSTPETFCLVLYFPPGTGRLFLLCTAASSRHRHHGASKGFHAHPLGADSFRHASHGLLPIRGTGQSFKKSERHDVSELTPFDLAGTNRLWSSQTD